MSFRTQPPPPRNEILRSYNMRKNEFIESVQSLSDTVEIGYPDGSRYVGQVREGQVRNGKGIYYYPSGDLYFGSWAEDEFSGAGVYMHGNG